MSSELADAKTRAEIAKLEAEAEHQRELAAVARVTRLKEEADYADELVIHAQRRRKDEWDEGKDARNGVFYFNDGVSDKSVAQLRDFITTFSRVHPAEPITVIFNSGGGSVFDGLDAADCIEEAIAAGHHVTTKVAGMAASMAGALLQFGTVRVVGRNSYLHLHEVAAGSMGKASSLMDTAERAKILTQQICDKYAERAKASIGDDAMTGEQIHAWIERQERWLTAQEAVDRGFADVIG